ncbi:hypothetical protein AVEN_142427-1 [Araneus ventricosus]|uniref:Uncharacterized protein n=1 Tax=Araneus ventricosus TaxID=182803 RepID=A0A4Y2IEH9_ARAVE|nr:hypothetical protein AVEN_142427-1 [Araneus ventricosus]
MLKAAELISDFRKQNNLKVVHNFLLFHSNAYKFIKFKYIGYKRIDMRRYLSRHPILRRTNASTKSRFNMCHTHNADLQCDFIWKMRFSHTTSGTLPQEPRPD